MISKFKRAILIVCALIMVLSMASCNNTPGNTEDTGLSTGTGADTSGTTSVPVTPPDITLPEDTYDGKTYNMTLPTFFKTNALFQANAPLTLKGKGAPNALYKVEVKNKDVLWAGGYTTSDKDGNFVLTIDKTPHASFDYYKVVVSGGGASSTIQNVLFGELWLCSGQSNMELFNNYQPGYKDFLDEAKTKKIRVLVTGNNGFSYDPIYQGNCSWVDAKNKVAMETVSGLGLKYASEIYDFLNANAEVPVGIIYAAFGGTPIYGWFPRDAVEQDKEMLEILTKNGQYTSKENYPAKFYSAFAQYHSKLASLEGIKVRGVLWYQGENETGGEFANKTYATYLKFYHKVYSERFAAYPDEFKVISSLIYPYPYGISGECNVGYINNAFIQTALAEPSKFVVVPNYDLTPYWSFVNTNNGIHPLNKYPLGERTAKIAISNIYNGPDSQKTAAYLKEWKVEGDKIKLTFDSVGSGLFVDSTYGSPDQPIGLYVAGSDGIYLPAKCSIESADTMLVWCDEIKSPVNVAYAVQSMEIYCSLRAGSYPVLPFFTETKVSLNIQSRPWYDTSRETMWVYVNGDCHSRPVWQPLTNSEVCHDSANTRGVQSVHVNASGSELEFGCYIKAYHSNELDLRKFNTLSVDLYTKDTITAKIVVREGVEVPLVKTKVLDGGWVRYEADLTSIKDAKTLSFVFQATNPNAYVNIENVRLSK